MTSSLTVAPSTGNTALKNAIIVGTILQLAMVLSGHWVEIIRLRGFAIGGMLISAVAGVVYARMARVSRRAAARNGAIAGAACAIVGIAVSVALGDTAPFILAVGTVSSAVTGAIGGGIAGGAK